MSRSQRHRVRIAARMSGKVGPGFVESMIDAPEFDLVFADDSRQSKPYRPRMGPMVGIGGVIVPAENVRQATDRIEDLCVEYRFPKSEEFKWSPGKEHWMRKNLTGDNRREFFVRIMDILREAEAVAIFVAEDEKCRSATGSDAKTDVTRLFLERVHNYCQSQGSYAMVVVDRPSGARKDEDKFLLNCLETIEAGTEFVVPSRIVHNVVSTPSKLSRFVQVADVVVSCSLAAVCGETTYAPPVLEAMLPLYRQDSAGRVGGYGVKIHPDFKYANLYYWLFRDKEFWRGNCGTPLPLTDRPYAKDPMVE